MHRFMLSTVLLSLGFSAVSPTIRHRNSQGSLAQQPEITVVKLVDPVYPPLARQAGIFGDVEIELQLRSDGTVTSVKAVSGHPLLQSSAVESVKQSKFECKNCGEETRAFHVLYSF